MKLPLAKDGVFHTIQGEGALLGAPMIFIRLAGCSVGCPQCDTDYGVAERVHVDEIIRRCQEIPFFAIGVWVTGGEPTDHDLMPLLTGLWDAGIKYRALATSGVRRVKQGESARERWDFISVSPHDEDWVQRSGNQVNLVPGLNGLRLIDFADLAGQMEDNFMIRYVTPLYGDQESLRECQKWVLAHRGWSLGVQAHKVWGMK